MHGHYYRTFYCGTAGVLHGTKNWIYCTFDTSQKLSQIWYWL